MRENHVKAGVGLFKLLDCTEIVIEGAGKVLVRTIPLLTDWAKCVNFAPDAKGDLGIRDLFPILNQFLKKIIMSAKCMKVALKTVKGYVEPHVKEFMDEKCLE